MNINDENVGEARAKIFMSIVMKEGTILRGVLMMRMRMSPDRFQRDYKNWLEMYPTIKYDKGKRVFTYQP